MINSYVQVHLRVAGILWADFVEYVELPDNPLSLLSRQWILALLSGRGGGRKPTLSLSRLGW